jgi:aminomethyltransferase
MPSGCPVDDIIVYRRSERRYLVVVNAANVEKDWRWLLAQQPSGCGLHDLSEQFALLALQGPKAEAILKGLTPVDLAAVGFYHFAEGTVDGHEAIVARTGYTGEDGFEISVEARHAPALWDMLLRSDALKPIGLGARDSLRLEAGLCLYGHDIDETTSPIEAALAWSIQKRRRVEGGFPGTARILDELANGPKRKRVGLRPDGKAPAREGTEILALLGERLGTVTSGGFGPSVNGPIAMGYVLADYAGAGTPVNLMVRGKALSAAVAPMPFVPHRYARKS